MKKIILMLTAVAASLSLTAQKVPGLANSYSGKVVYIESNPTTPYRHVGTVECSMLAPDKFDLMMTHMIEKRALKEYKTEEFDALIFRPGSGFCKADVIQFYRDPKEKKKKSRKGVEEEILESFRLSESVGKGGINLFVENNPTAAFTLLGKIELPTNFVSSEYEDLLKEMIRVAKQAYPDMNGIVIQSGTELRKANVIKLKE
jgi:hypothetical protein